MLKERVRAFLTPSVLTLVAFFAADLAAQSGEGGQLFGDWVVHCDTQSARQSSCKMSQMAVVETTSEPLLRINIRYQPGIENMLIQFVVPLGVSLKHTPQLYLDRRPAGPVALDMCLQDGCYSTFNLNTDLLERLLSMYEGELKLHAGNGEAVQIPISGNGSRAAFSAMQTMARALAKTSTP